MEDNKLNIMGDRIRQQRLANDMTMQELADKLSVGRSAVNKWEKGHVTNIKRDTISQMAQIFGCSPVWLMGMDDVINIDITSPEEQKSFTRRRIRAIHGYASRVSRTALTNNEKIVLRLFRQLNTKQRKAVISYMQFMIQQAKSKKKEVPDGIF